MLIFKNKNEIKNKYEVLRVNVPPSSSPMPYNLLCAKKSFIKNRIVEIPLCGVTWEMPYRAPPKVDDYSMYPKLAVEKQRKVFFDKVSLSYYFVWKENNKQYISFFDTDETLIQKCQYVKSMGAAGFLTWPENFGCSHTLKKLSQC